MQFEKTCEIISGMANEVLILEYSKPVGGDLSSIGGYLVTSQVLDIATVSAAFNSSTDYVIVKAIGTGFWFKTGNSTVSAAANTAGNDYIFANTQSDPIPVSGNRNYIDTAAAV